MLRWRRARQIKRDESMPLKLPRADITKEVQDQPRINNMNSTGAGCHCRVGLIQGLREDISGLIPGRVARRIAAVLSDDSLDWTTRSAKLSRLTELISKKGSIFANKLLADNRLPTSMARVLRLPKVDEGFLLELVSLLSKLITIGYPFVHPPSVDLSKYADVFEGLVSLLAFHKGKTAEIILRLLNFVISPILHAHEWIMDFLLGIESFIPILIKHSLAPMNLSWTSESDSNTEPDQSILAILTRSECALTILVATRDFIEKAQSNPLNRKTCTEAYRSYLTLLPLYTHLFDRPPFNFPVSSNNSKKEIVTRKQIQYYVRDICDPLNMPTIVHLELVETPNAAYDSEIFNRNVNRLNSENFDLFLDALFTYKVRDGRHHPEVIELGWTLLNEALDYRLGWSSIYDLLRGKRWVLIDFITCFEAAKAGPHEEKRNIDNCKIMEASLKDKGFLIRRSYYRYVRAIISMLSAFPYQVAGKPRMLNCSSKSPLKILNRDIMRLLARTMDERRVFE